MRRPSRQKATAKRPGLGSKGDLGRRGRLDGGWMQVPESIRERINRSTRVATAAIMNDLAEKGPATTGAFRDSWKAEAVTGGLNNPTSSGYPYKTQDVPRVDITAKTMNTVKLFSISNMTPYADIAMDLKPGRFQKREDPIEGGVEFGVAYGKRDQSPNYRGAVTEGRGRSNYSTAELDWYTNYVSGGGMDQTFGVAISKEFKRVVNLPKGKR